MGLRTFAASSLFLSSHAEMIGPCFLYDLYCMKNPNDTPDGTQPFQNPYNHKAGCFDVPRCKDSGYGLLCYNPNAANNATNNVTGIDMYEKVHEFDRTDATNATVRAYIEFLKNTPKEEADGCVMVDATKVAVEGENFTELSNVRSIVHSNNCQPCKEASALGRPELRCKHTVMPDVLDMHYGVNDSAQTVSFCLDNLLGEGWIAFGPGTEMSGSQAVYSRQFGENITVWNITAQATPTETDPDFGETKTSNFLENGTHRSCFTMPMSQLRPAGNKSLTSTSFVWAVGESNEFMYHGTNRDVLNFNFRTGRSPSCTAGPEGKACQNSGKATGMEATGCTCSCTGTFTGKWCETTNAGACVRSDLEDEGLECKQTLKQGVLDMHFTVNKDAETISICLVNEKEEDGTGWIGFGPGEGMLKGVRGIVAREENNGALEVFNITEQKRPDVKIEDYGLTNAETKVVNNKRRSCFTIPFARLHPDGADSLQAAQFAWAVGGAGFSRHSDRDGPVEVNFETGSTTTESADIPTLIIIHIICMMVSFLLLYPAGVLIAAHAGPGFQKGAKFFNAHRFAMLLAIVVSLVGFVCALAALGELDTVHGFFGIVVMALCLVQPVNGHFRPAKTHPNRCKWEILHKTVGRTAFLLGFVTCLLGAVVFGERNYEPYAAVLVLAIVFTVLSILLLIVLRLKQKKPADKKSNADNDIPVGYHEPREQAAARRSNEP